MRHGKQAVRLRRADFNPRTPCGVRPASCSFTRFIARFQSTHPLRGATIDNLAVTVVKLYFNPRTPCGVRLPSIYTLTTPAEFQSTHPLRGATFCTQKLNNFPKISIHAPLAGCDPVPAESFTTDQHFNPRTPCGVRPVHHTIPVLRSLFQSTHPLRGATLRLNTGASSMPIFQSTHPLRGATKAKPEFHGHRVISIHAPLAGCDRPCRRSLRRPRHFNPRTPCGVRRGVWFSISPAP